MKKNIQLCIAYVVLITTIKSTHANIKQMGDNVQYALPAIAFSSTLLQSDFEGTMQLLKSFATSSLTTELLKKTTRKERPDKSNKFSFPSGHTSAAFQSASFIHFRYGLSYAIPAYIAASFVGYSRVHEKRHDIIDVTAGAALGIFSSWYFTTRKEDKSALIPTFSQDGILLNYIHSW
ncbi:phosphatase PAP2 family protein [Endozoicomonas sp. Mp262]|uniref:phosphatase PAP2 family protein n=1 Tax=Endozoicomonas sp. Mp262 TaxID=2919499 RepID=UPI0021DB26CE